MAYNRYELEHFSGDGQINLADILPFKSVVWEESYNDIGTMQAVFPKTLDNVQSIRTGSFATIPNTAVMMYIHSVKVTDDELWAYGMEAKGLLSKQGLMPRTELQGKQRVGDAILNAWHAHQGYTFFDNINSFVPRMSERNLDALEYWSLLEFIQQACALEKAGFRLDYVPNTSKLALNVWQGRDLSETVRFATVLGNAQGISYSIDDQSEIYEVVAVGDDDGTTVTASATGSGTPLERTKAYLDLRSEYPKPEEMTSEEYIDALQTRATMSQIARHSQQKLTVKSVDVTDFGDTFGLGDIVGIDIPEYRVQAKARVITMRRTLEGNSDKLEVDLSISV